MTELTYDPVQSIGPSGNAIFNTTIGCPKGYVIHRNGSGIVILRGAVNNRCARSARYQVMFNGNIALSEGATVGPISIALSVNGEAISTSNATVTPAAVSDFFNVTSTAIIDVPRGCCFTIGVKNTSVGAATIPSIDMKNANLEINKQI